MTTTTAVLCVTAVLALACGGPPVDPRLGQLQPGVGLVTGIGQTDGRDWAVGTDVDGNLVCQTLFVDGIGVSSACSGLAVAGSNDMVVSGNVRDQQLMLAGYAALSIAQIEVTTDRGSFLIRPVPLTALGLTGNAFGMYLPRGVPLDEVRWIDHDGNIVERQPLPKIRIDPGSSN